MKFGENLKQIRKEKNISQEELAEKLGVARQSISKWETGENYPSMQNIMCLCDIFKCKINVLVHENISDLNSLDEDVKMGVVKFKEEKQKKVKTLSNILYLIGKIGAIVLSVAIPFILLAMVCVPIALKYIDVQDDKIVLLDGDSKFEVEEKDNGIVIKHDNKEEIVKASKSDIINFKNALSHFSKTTFIILMEIGFIFLIVFVILTIIALKHLEKLFYNIHEGDTPFTLDNVNHIKKMSYIMIASIVIATIASSFMSAAFARDVMVNINMYNIVEIIFLFALSYIFEYGYEIQLDSKGKIYGNTKE